jgi:hypothetical protein
VFLKNKNVARNSHPFGFVFVIILSLNFEVFLGQLVEFRGKGVEEEEGEDCNGKQRIAAPHVASLFFM